MEERYKHIVRGYNYRMEGLQGAILRVKLKYLEQWTEARRAHGERYNSEFADIPGVVTPQIMPYARHVFHVYALRLAQRARCKPCSPPRESPALSTTPSRCICSPRTRISAITPASSRGGADVPRRALPAGVSRVERCTDPTDCGYGSQSGRQRAEWPRPPRPLI